MNMPAGAPKKAVGANVSAQAVKPCKFPHASHATSDVISRDAEADRDAESIIRMLACTATVPQVLIPFDAKEACTLNVAAARAGVCAETVKNWCKVWHIGRQIGAPGGHWRVSKAALQMFLDGNWKTLGLYLKGNRSDFDVARYVAESKK